MRRKLPVETGEQPCSQGSLQGGVHSPREAGRWSAEPTGREEGDSRRGGEFQPREALVLLALSALLFWAGALVLPEGNAWWIAGLLPPAAFLLPTVIWALARGRFKEAFPAGRVSLANGTVAAALILGGSLSALAIAGTLSGLPGAGRQEEVLRAFLLEYGPASRFLLFALVPALCEEALFRGGLLACLRRWPPAAACLFSGAVFALFHGSWLRFLPVALLGAALAAVVWRTRNLWFAVIGHGLHNAVVLSAIASPARGDLSWPVLGAMGTAGAALIALGLVLPVGKERRDPASGPLPQA